MAMTATRLTKENRRATRKEGVNGSSTPCLPFDQWHKYQEDLAKAGFPMYEWPQWNSLRPHVRFQIDYEMRQMIYSISDIPDANAIQRAAAKLLTEAMLPDAWDSTLRYAKTKPDELNVYFYYYPDSHTVPFDPTAGRRNSIDVTITDRIVFSQRSVQYEFDLVDPRCIEYAVEALRKCLGITSSKPSPAKSAMLV